MTERIQLHTQDGETLEARWDSPDDPKSAVVFCHAHPLQRGTMTNPLMIGVTLRLVERGFSVLRFNFRGTGESTGTHGKGVSELEDVEAAYQEAVASGLSVTMTGWSFGAGTSLRWVADRGVEIPYVGIAPAPNYLPESVPPGPKRIVLGTRDQVIDGDEVVEYAKHHKIDLVLTPGDHFFHGKGDRIGDLVGQGLE